MFSSLSQLLVIISKFHLTNSNLWENDSILSILIINIKNVCFSLSHNYDSNIFELHFQSFNVLYTNLLTKKRK